MNKNLKLYAGTVVACFMGGTIWLSVDLPVSEHADCKAAHVSRNHAATGTENFSAFFRSVMSSDDIEGVARQVCGFGIRSLSDFSNEIYSAFTEDEGATAEWLRALSSEMAKLDEHERALELLDLLTLPKAVPGIEREVYMDWLKDDPSIIFSKLEQGVKNGNVNAHQMSMLASMFQNEFSEKFSDFISWAENNEDPILLGLVVDKVVTQLEESNTEAVKELISRNLDNGIVTASLFDFVRKYSLEDRSQALEWISNLETSDFSLKAEASAAVIREIAIEDVDKAMVMLSSDHFLSHYYYSGSDKHLYTAEGDWAPEAKLFYDHTLEAFINGALLVDPELAKNSIDAFFDEKRKASYTKFFKENSIVYGGDKPDQQLACTHCNKVGSHTH